MKNWKLPELLNTPLGIVIVVSTITFAVEYLFMVALHDVLTPLLSFKLSDNAWDFIDAATLATAISLALYFLVFRKMQESEERFRQINAAALNAIVIVNEQTLITDWNPAAQKMFQYSREEAVGQQLHQLIAPPRYHDDAARGFDRFQEIGTGPLVGKTTEISALRKDGSEFPIELSISAVKLKGRWHAIGIIHDITERKRAEEAIIKAGENFHTLFDSIPDAIFITGMDGRFLDVNHSACERLGYSKEELLKMHPTDIGTPEYAAKVPERIKALLEQGKLVFESAHVHRDGSVITIELSDRVVDYAGRPALLGVARDITERKQAEETLKNSEQQYRTMIENSNDMIWTLTADGRFAFINQQAADVTGRSIEDWLGKTFELLVLEEDLPMVLEIHGKVMSGEKVHYKVRSKKADGGILTLSVNASPIFKDGKVSGTISFARDITEQKLAEAKLAEHTEELHRWHDITMGREMRTLELKREINELLRQAGQPPRYLSVASAE